MGAPQICLARSAHAMGYASTCSWQVHHLDLVAALELQQSLLLRGSLLKAWRLWPSWRFEVTDEPPSWILERNRMDSSRVGWGLKTQWRHAERKDFIFPRSNNSTWKMNGREKLLIYFCGSIRGGKQDTMLYKRIIEQLKEYGEVLTEHVGDLEAQEREIGALFQYGSKSFFRWARSVTLGLQVPSFQAETRKPNP